MLRVHKIKLQPNKTQSVYFAKACGVARHAYNWALSEWSRQYEAGLKPSPFALSRQYNAIKPVDFPWSMEVANCVPKQAIKNVGVAFKNFFRRINQDKKRKGVSYPKFKKKGHRDSFRADNGPRSKGISAVPVDGKRVKLPIIGWIRMREELRFQGCIQSTTVSKAADGWYIAILVDTDTLLERTASKGVVGVDMGLIFLAVLSTGEVITGPKPHRALDARLRMLNRSLSRKKKGSANFRKAKAKLSKLHKRIADIRKDALHKLSHRLATEFNVIGIEDLCVKGMARNKRLARSVADAGMGGLRSMIEYKAAMTGAEVVHVDRWYPSSKTCSCCGQIHNEIVLGVKTMDCDCGLVMDRDLNAAINIANYAASSAVTARGEPGSDVALAA